MESNGMRVAAIQMPVLMDVAANLQHLEAAVISLRPGTLAVAPEGCLSGYLPEPGMVRHLRGSVTANAIEAAHDVAKQAGVHLIAGACVEIDGAWRNASYYLGPSGERWRYDKINLATSERGDFTPGDKLPVLDLLVDGLNIRVGVQMCREIRYPEQWRHLARQGAQIIAYVNNAIGNAAGPTLWRAHVVSRAAENQRFVVGANNAAVDQGCTSLVVAPSGKVLAEAKVGAVAITMADIDLAEVSDSIIDQARTDVVSVEVH
jgi:predicted amidohydrolase